MSDDPITRALLPFLALVPRSGLPGAGMVANGSNAALAAAAQTAQAMAQGVMTDEFINHNLTTIMRLAVAALPEVLEQQGVQTMARNFARNVVTDSLVADYCDTAFDYATVKLPEVLGRPEMQCAAQDYVNSVATEEFLTESIDRALKVAVARLPGVLGQAEVQGAAQRFAQDVLTEEMIDAKVGTAVDSAVANLGRVLWENVELVLFALFAVMLLHYVLSAFVFPFVFRHFAVAATILLALLVVFGFGRLQKGVDSSTAPARVSSSVHAR